MLVHHFVEFVVKRREYIIHVTFAKRAFHFTLQRSAFNLSLEKREKSRILHFFTRVLSFMDFKMQNCEKWSLMSEFKFPQATTLSGLLIKILSIRVAEVERTRVGLSIAGVR